MPARAHRQTLKLYSDDRQKAVDRKVGEQPCTHDGIGKSNIESMDESSNVGWSHEAGGAVVGLATVALGSLNASPQAFHASLVLIYGIADGLLAILR